jgi:hypothetical protein
MLSDPPIKAPCAADVEEFAVFTEEPVDVARHEAERR